MVSYLPEIRAGMALLLAFCAMVQDLRNFKIGNQQILVGLLGAAGCMAYEWMMGGVCAEQLTAGFSVLGVLYMVYLIGGIGAGDVKLLAVTGFIWGRPVWKITVLAFLIASGMGLAGILSGKLKKREMNVMNCTSVCLHVMHFGAAVFAAELVTGWLMF